MARHTCSFIVSIAIDDLQPLLVALLQDLELNVQYHTDDYIMARETPGKVSFLKLVIVEVLTDKSTSTETESRFSIVVKNEQLQLDDHCRQMFEFVRQAIEGSDHWHLIESLAA
jgi:hypothetical protein